MRALAVALLLAAWPQPACSASALWLSSANVQELPTPRSAEAYCTRNADELCGPAQAPLYIELTPDRQAELSAVDRAINRRIHLADDVNSYHLPDFWADGRISDYGDCEDFVIAKIKELVEHGWPLSALGLLIVSDNPDFHAVLVVHTTEGDVIADSGSRKLAPLASFKFKPVEMSMGSFHHWAPYRDLRMSAMQTNP